MPTWMMRSFLLVAATLMLFGWLSKEYRFFSKEDLKFASDRKVVRQKDFPTEILRAPANLDEESKSSFSEIKEKYPKQIADARFDAKGRLTSIHGRKGARPYQEFSPKRKEDVSKVSHRWIKDLRPFLGLTQGVTLSQTDMRLGPFSAQVTYHQFKEGVPVEPYGRVHLDLGKGGELLSFSSDLVPTGEQSLEWSVSAKEAYQRLEESGVLKPPLLQEGRRIVWVFHRQNEDSKAIAAYEFHSGGKRLVVDARNGELLLAKDGRQRIGHRH